MKLAIRAICLACGEKHAVAGVHCAGALKGFLDEQGIIERSVGVDLAKDKDQTVKYIYEPPYSHPI